MVYRLLLVVFLLFSGIALRAQAERAPDYVVYMLNGRVYAQAIFGTDLIDFGEPSNEVERAFTQGVPNHLDDYTLRTALLRPDANDNYGFYHGVAGGNNYAFLELEHLGTGYRVSSDFMEVLIEGQISTQQGYLDPLGWTAEGDLLLLERTMRYRLNTVRIWLYDGESTMIHREFNIGPLFGRSAVMPSGDGAFIGVDIANNTGYTYNFELSRLFAFQFNLPPADPPRSVFELYPHPIHVLGMMTLDDARDLRTAFNQPMPPLAIPERPAPFLYWPLNDAERRITCYPDSNWTNANFTFVCAGMSPPSGYPGHQGTDVSGERGLPLGTPIYAAAPGVVVGRFDVCEGGEIITCGDAYGNFVTLEHRLTVGNESQLWFTGYAHLSQPLVTVGNLITDLTQPIALSGETGIGGPHLHFEVRHWHINTRNLWVDPWGASQPPYDQPLWIGGIERPTSVVFD